MTFLDGGDSPLVKPTRIAAIAILVLNVLDLLTTFYALHHGASEMNPVSKFLIESYLLVPMKLAICAGIVWGAFKETNIKLLCISWFVTGVYSLVIVLNLVTILRAT